MATTDRMIYHPYSGNAGHYYVNNFRDEYEDRTYRSEWIQLEARVPVVMPPPSQDRKRTRPRPPKASNNWQAILDCTQSTPTTTTASSSPSPAAVAAVANDTKYIDLSDNDGPPSVYASPKKSTRPLVIDLHRKQASAATATTATTTTMTTTTISTTATAISTSTSTPLGTKLIKKKSKRALKNDDASKLTKKMEEMPSFIDTGPNKRRVWYSVKVQIRRVWVGLKEFFLLCVVYQNGAV